MALGTILSILMGAISSNSFPVNMLLAVIIGMAIGFGLPSTLAYFADSTSIAKRGIHGGITWLVVGIGGLSIGAIISTQQIKYRIHWFLYSCVLESDWTCFVYSSYKEKLRSKESYT